MSSGPNKAVFKESGEVPVNKEWLTIFNNSSERQLKTVVIEMGSSGMKRVRVGPIFKSPLYPPE